MLGVRERDHRAHVERRLSSALFTGSFSVVPTRRRRFFWAAWWTAPPEADPFRKPDASSGGARTPEEARAAAELAAGTPLVETDARWAGAWVRVLRGEPPFPKPREPRPSREVNPPAPAGSRAWALQLLGLPNDASADAVKRAFRVLALRTHPDRGGDAVAFMEAKRALDAAVRVKAKRR